MNPKPFTYVDFGADNLIVHHPVTNGLTMNWRHHHSHYELLFIREGAAMIDSNALTITATAPCMVIHKPFCLHRANAPTDAIYDRYIINIDSELWNKIGSFIPCFSIFSSSQISVIPLDEALFRELDEIYAIIYRDYKAGKRDRALIYIALMLLQVSEYAHTQGITTPDHEGYISDVVRYISTHFADDMNIDQIADRFFVSRSKLISDFKKSTGVTVKKYLMFVKIANAQYLLTAGKTISEVTSICGFYDNSHFISTFRLFTGMTPKEFVRKNEN